MVTYVVFTTKSLPFTENGNTLGTRRGKNFDSSNVHIEGTPKVAESV